MCCVAGAVVGVSPLHGVTSGAAVVVTVEDEESGQAHVVSTLVLRSQTWWVVTAICLKDGRGSHQHLSPSSYSQRR